MAGEGLGQQPAWWSSPSPHPCFAEDVLLRLLSITHYSLPESIQR